MLRRKKSVLMILTFLILWTNSTSAAIVLRKGEPAPFDGALLPESEMRDVLKDSSFRLTVEPLLNEPLEENPLNFECAGGIAIPAFLVGLAVNSDNQKDQVVLLSSSVAVFLYTLSLCL